MKKKEEYQAAIEQALNEPNMTLSALKETEMTYHEAIAAYLSNLTDRAKRLGVARDTLYKWRANPDSANLERIRADLTEQLAAINGRIASLEKKTTAHGLQIAEGGELEVQILNIAQ